MGGHSWGRAASGYGGMLEIGTTLRDARERLGLDLAECERATRIRAGQLRALEEGRFEKLPEPPYTRGFLRTYAGLLGLDGDRLVAEYDRLLGEDDRLGAHALQPLPPPETRIEALRGRLPPPRRPRRTTVLRWLSVGGIVVLGILAWLGVTGHQSSPPEPRPTAVASTRPAASAPARSPAAVPPRAMMTVTGLPPSGSYIEVHRTDRDGPLLYEGTVTPGSSRRWRLGRPIWIRVGWTPSLRVRIGRRAVPLSGGTANFSISRSGAQPA